MEYNFLRDLERLEKYGTGDVDDTYLLMLYWTARGRLSVYKDVLGYDKSQELVAKWENELKPLPEALRWNVMICPTLRIPREGEKCCYACSNYEADPEVDSCIKFGISHSMDDSDDSDFSIYTCDEFED